MRQFGLELRKQLDNEFVASSDDRMPLYVLFLMSVEFMCIRIPAVSVWYEPRVSKKAILH